MKISSLVLPLSVAANVALLAWLIVPRAVPPRLRAASPAGHANAPGSGALAAREAAPADQPAPSPLWLRLNPGDDLPALVARLRAAGFPPMLVRAIITSLVEERFDAERYRIDAVALHTPYWKAWPNSSMDPKVGPALRKLSRDQQDLVKQLLGDTGPDEATEESKAWRQQAMGNLSPEKMDRLSTYLAAGNEKRMAIYAAAGVGRSGGGQLLPADREKLAALDRSLRDGLTEFLTPAEAGEFNLRAGDAANQLKWMLNPFRASEEEYRTIFPLYQAYRDQFPSAGFGGATNTPADPAQQVAQDALFAQLASALGQPRVDELKLALDPKYAALNRLVDRLDLPLAASRQVFDVQQDIQQRAAAIRNNPILEAGDRSAQLAALADEATKKISAALGGDRGLAAYQQNGGQWLSSLTPPKG